MNYSNILEKELPDILDRLITDFDTHYPWIIAGGSVANTAINYLFNETLPINDIDTYIFNGQGKSKLGIDQVLAEQFEYDRQTIFTWMDFAVGPVDVDPPYTLIPVKFSLLGQADFDEVIAPYFLQTFPLNCEKIAYNPQTRKVICSKAFLEFLQHRTILFNPIHVDTSTCLFRALRKHDQRVGKLSSNYVRRVFHDDIIRPPSNKKYDPQFEQLKTYPFIYQPKDVYYLLFEPLPNHKPVLDCENIHTTVAFENERMFYTDATLKQAQEIIQGQEGGLLYLITSIVEPEFLRKPISKFLKNKIKAYPDYFNELFAQCLLAPSVEDILSITDGLFNFNQRYMRDEVIPQLITDIRYGVKDIFIKATEEWHKPITFWKFKHQIKSKAEMGEITTSSWHFSELLRNKFYSIGQTLFKSPKIEHGKDKLEMVYNTNPKLYTFIKIIDSKISVDNNRIPF